MSKFELYGDKLTRKIVFLVFILMIVTAGRIIYKEGQKHPEPATYYTTYHE
jgi:uncharacterized PurR-regulated membrane protein YhhQ (DUF165 family)